MVARWMGRAVARVVIAFAFACAILWLYASPELRAQAAAPESSAGITVNREILGLFDSTTEQRADLSRLHKFLEMPLNHLGYKLTLHDIAKGVPADGGVKRYKAVATWFSGRVANADAYLAWAAKTAKGGTRFVVLDSVGVLGGEAELPAVNAFLGELGLAYAPYYVGDTKATRLAAHDPAFVGFEHKLDPDRLDGYQVVAAAPPAAKGPKATAHLSVTDPALAWVKAPAAILAATGPRGGLVATGFAMHYDPAKNLTRWIINPFEFLGAALGADAARPSPVPDTTTVSGRRLYFSHVDGDGWNNATTVEPYAAKGQTAAQAMLERLIAAYPDLPVSVGLIAGDADPADGGAPEAGQLAKAMFALPQVEVASHTHTHPFHWSFFESYKRDQELGVIEGFLARNPGNDNRGLAALKKAWLASKQKVEHAAVAQDVPPDAGVASAASASISRDPPRANPNQPYTLAREIAGALEQSTRLAPKGKAANLYLWSGDTRPYEAAVKATREAGVRNLNGGDTRMDRQFPSVGYVAPLSRVIGAERQIYAVNSNENTYTNGWTGPYDAFATLSETLENTEVPRRLKGVNVYYHTFSATRPDGLAAVAGHLEMARNAQLAPITASHYAGIADGFFSTEFVRLGEARWRIENRGELDTVRFDHADMFGVDYGASSGVIGHNRHEGSLYVTLDSQDRAPVVAINKRAAGRPAANRPYLVESRWVWSDVKLAPCDISATVQGFGWGKMAWGGLLPGGYVVTASRDGRELARMGVSANADGRLSARLPADAITPLTVRIACAESARGP
jgi:polysaccharide biosynthesis protein PelA